MKTRLIKLFTAAALALGITVGVGSPAAHAGGYGATSHPTVQPHYGLDPVMRDIIRVTLHHIAHADQTAPKKGVKKKAYKKGYREGYKDAKRESRHDRKQRKSHRPLREKVWYGADRDDDDDDEYEDREDRRHAHKVTQREQWAWKNHKRKMKAHRVAANDRPGQNCYTVTKDGYTKNGRSVLFGATACENKSGKIRIVKGTRHIIERY